MKPLATNSDIKAEFRKAIDYWTPLLGLSAWRIELVFEATGEDPKADGFFAACECVPEYELARITCNVAALLNYGFNALQLEAVALHELCHIVLWLLGNHVANPALPEALVTYHEETTTEAVCQALLRTRYGLKVTPLTRIPLAR